MTSDISSASVGVRPGDAVHQADINAHTASAMGAAMATSNASDRASGLAVIGATTSRTNMAAPSSAAPHSEYT
jgi:hypothetical protein